MPFLLHFVERIEQPPQVRIHHDPVDQISRVEIDGVWIDAVDAKDVLLEAGTRLTDVKRETTDDN